MRSKPSRLAIQSSANLIPLMAFYPGGMLAKRLTYDCQLQPQLHHLAF
jgi:hypothetical protein